MHKKDRLHWRIKKRLNIVGSSTSSLHPEPWLFSPVEFFILHLFFYLCVFRLSVCSHSGRNCETKFSVCSSQSSTQRELGQSHNNIQDSAMKFLSGMKNSNWKTETLRSDQLSLFFISWTDLLTLTLLNNAKCSK